MNWHLVTQKHDYYIEVIFVHNSSNDSRTNVESVIRTPSAFWGAPTGEEDAFIYGKQLEISSRKHVLTIKGEINDVAAAADRLKSMFVDNNIPFDVGFIKYGSWIHKIFGFIKFQDRRIPRFGNNANLIETKGKVYQFDMNRLYKHLESPFHDSIIKAINDHMVTNEQWEFALSTIIAQYCVSGANIYANFKPCQQDSVLRKFLTMKDRINYEVVGCFIASKMIDQGYFVRQKLYL